MDAINQPLLDVRDLSVAFGAGDRATLAVDRISYSMRRGECVALVGVADHHSRRDRDHLRRAGRDGPA